MSKSRKEWERITRQENTLIALGFTQDEAESLRRISMTLQRWHELECGTDRGCIERDETTNRPYWVSEWGTRWTYGKRCRTPMADRETGARNRLAAIVDACNKARRTHMAGDRMTPLDGLRYYVQTDPRGAALYIIRPGDVPEGGDVGAYYSRGICVY